MTKENDMSMEIARECVARGVALLDREMPGWYEKIDLGVFAIQNIERCALGQLYPESEPMPRWARFSYPSLEHALKDYVWPETSEEEIADHVRFLSEPMCTANYDLGRIKLGLNENELRTHGFNRLVPDLMEENPYPDAVEDEWGVVVDYAKLDEAWTEVIKARAEDGVYTIG